MPNSNETKADQRGNEMVVKATNTQDMKSEGHQNFGVGLDAHGTFKPADTAQTKDSDDAEDLWDNLPI